MKTWFPDASTACCKIWKVPVTLTGKFVDERKKLEHFKLEEKAICHTVSLDNSITVVFFHRTQRVWIIRKYLERCRLFCVDFTSCLRKVSSVLGKFSRIARLSMIQERIGKFKTTFIVNFEDRLFSSIGASSTRLEWNPLTADTSTKICMRRDKKGWKKR